MVLMFDKLISIWDYLRLAVELDFSTHFARGINFFYYIPMSVFFYLGLFFPRGSSSSSLGYLSLPIPVLCPIRKPVLAHVFLSSAVSKSSFVILFLPVSPTGHLEYLVSAVWEIADFFSHFPAFLIASQDRNVLTSVHLHFYSNRDFPLWNSFLSRAWNSSPAAAVLVFISILIFPSLLMREPK